MGGPFDKEGAIGMERAKPPTKRKPPAFKPPGPASKKTKSSTAAPRRKSAPAKPQPISSGSSSDERTNPQRPDVDVSDISDDAPLPPPEGSASRIPPKLLTKLLHHHFEHDKTRIGQDANALLGKYMETFVREALARAAHERSKAEGGAAGRDFLEVREGETLPGWTG
ncbi:hypothetical protein MMC07_008581 [Pseudocyphellaria aurata]|nr:hypothetical protein [Pseudocyphellaria aurata]